MSSGYPQKFMRQVKARLMTGEDPEVVAKEFELSDKKVAKILAGECWSAVRPWAYCAGKMTGEPQYAFPIFDQARDLLNSLGWLAVSPVDHDRKSGFDGNGPLPSLDFRRKALAWDMQMITKCDAIAVLPSWLESSGARAEIALASAIGLQKIFLGWKDDELYVRRRVLV